MFDTKFSAVLERYEARATDEAKLWATTNPAELFGRRDELLLEVGPDTANFLLSLAVGRRAVRLVELGTSYGYSTLFLAEAARRTGGRLTTYELSSDKQSFAKDQIKEAGLGDYVEWRQGDAVELLKDEKDGIDFVLIDLWKELYVPCLEAIYPKLAQNAVLAADNILEPAMARPEAEAYRAAVRQKKDLQSVLLPIGSGIELSCRWIQ